MVSKTRKPVARRLAKSRAAKPVAPVPSLAAPLALAAVAPVPSELPVKRPVAARRRAPARGQAPNQVSARKATVQVSASKGSAAAKSVKPANTVKAAKAAKAPQRPVTAKPAKTPSVGKPIKAGKPKKAKLVRDNFRLPKPEHRVLEQLKQRAVQLGAPIKKSELLRAGIKALAAMNSAHFLAALAAVPAIKTGRPAKP